MSEETKSTFKIMMTLLLTVFSLMCVCFIFVPPGKTPATYGEQIYLGFQAAIYEVMAMLVYFNKIKD